jgi:6-phosphogluconolactonase (cycloisomerase 2 family)
MCLARTGSFAEGNPSFLATDTSGQYLSILGQVRGQVTAYKIDATSGGLDQFLDSARWNEQSSRLAVFQLKLRLTPDSR